MPFVPGMYQNIKRIVVKNIAYIANLMALMQWYAHVRSQFISDDFTAPLFEGLKEKLGMAIDERIQRLKALRQKMPESVIAYQNYAKEKASSRILKQKNEFFERIDALEAYFRSLGNIAVEENLKDAFLEKIRQGVQTSGKDYISVIKGLKDTEKKHGTLWLQTIVDHIIDGALELLPSFNRN
jgi:UDP-N-acetylglucosamine/UDP-N-acetylgalactosamine diphosphorylase